MTIFEYVAHRRAEEFVVGFALGAANHGGDVVHHIADDRTFFAVG